MPIKLNQHLKEKVFKGLKTATTRLGFKTYTLGQDTIEFPDKTFIEVEITKVYYIKFKDINTDLAQKEGHSIESLKQALINIYGTVSQEDNLTVIEFKINPLI